MAKGIYSNLDFQNVSRLVNLPNPAAAQEAATKAYVDSAIEGVAWKDSVRVATQSNLNLAAPGATINSISMNVSDRVLVRVQTTQSENGLYIWNGDAVAMTRSLDANTAAELEQAVVTVEEGTSAATSWRQTAVNFTLDTDPVAWTTFGASVGQASETSAGIAELATQAETDAGTDDLRIVTPLKLTAFSGRAKRFAQSVGDGSATQYVVTHNLGTQDVVVSVYRTSGSFDEIGCDIEHTTTNSVTVRFAAAPTSNQFRVVIVA